MRNVLNNTLVWLRKLFVNFKSFGVCTAFDGFVAIRTKQIINNEQ